MSERPNLCIVDLETYSLDIHRCEVVELAAVILDGETLAPLEGGEFQSYITPVDWTNYSPEAIKVNKITHELLKEKGKDRKAVFESFDLFCKQFRVKGAKFGGPPIAAGKNIRMFDLPILDRVCRQEKMAAKDGTNKFFDRRTVVDLEDLLFIWFRAHKGARPASMKMDDLRPFLGLSDANSHSALQDCKDEALIIKRFLELPGKYKVEFQGALAGATL